MLTEEQQTQSDVLPAGGVDPNRFDWKEAWYPVAYLADLDKAKLTRFTLLGQDLVIWWDQQGSCWRAFLDQCPHRLVPLSEGRIAEDGLLECPYHGWAFKGDGTCDRIPQQRPDQTAHESNRACVAAFPTAERQGLLFVYAGTPENADRVKIPVIEPMEESPEGWVCLDTFRDLPYDALTLLENVLDSSHVSFTHHRSMGNRANAAPVELEVLESGKQGFQGFWAEGPRKGTLGSQSSTFVAPSFMWHDLTATQFGRTLTVVYATPIRKGECRMFARFPFKFSSKLPSLFIKLTPRWYSHIRNNNIIEDDQIFLHHQERTLAAKGGSAYFANAFYLPTRSDAFISELRKWVNKFEADPFPGQALPPAQSAEALLDRYHSHTVHCSSCRNALTTIQQIRLVLVIVALITGILLPVFIPSLVSAIVALSTIAVWFGLGKLERQFYQGRRVPLRNLPEKK